MLLSECQSTPREIDLFESRLEHLDRLARFALGLSLSVSQQQYNLIAANGRFMPLFFRM